MKEAKKLYQKCEAAKIKIAKQKSPILLSQ